MGFASLSLPSTSLAPFLSLSRLFPFALALFASPSPFSRLALALFVSPSPFSSHSRPFLASPSSSSWIFFPPLFFQHTHTNNFSLSPPLSQTTPSAPASCGRASRCSPPPRPVSLAAARCRARARSSGEIFLICLPFLFERRRKKRALLPSSLTLFLHLLQEKKKSTKQRVDLGGGTAYNVQSMLSYLPLECFRAIYVVDLAGPLCEQAQRRVDALPGWKGVVHVVRGDAATFVPPSPCPDSGSGLGSVDLVTFSYSLSMMPPFLDAVDHAAALLKPGTGCVLCFDFFLFFFFFVFLSLLSETGFFPPFLLLPSLSRSLSLSTHGEKSRE